MRDFNQQLKAYGKEMTSTRYPYSEAELDREIRNVVWNTTPRENTITPHIRLLWPAVAAAIVAAIAIPTALFASNGNLADEVASVNVDGEQLYFACNNGCTADATIETFKTLLR